MITTLIGYRDGSTDVQGFDIHVTQEDLDFVHEAVHQDNLDDAKLMLHAKGSDGDAVIEFVRAHPLKIELVPPPRAPKSTQPPPL